MGYEQDDYDKWFAKVIVYLSATVGEHKQFKKLADFAAMVGIERTNLSAIKNGVRGVPKEQRDAIDKILRDKFKIQRSIATSYRLKDPENFEVKEPAAVHELHSANSNILRETIDTLKEYNGFIKAMYEQSVKGIQVNLELVVENQKLMMRQLNVESYLAVERHVGGDKTRLELELQKRDTLISSGQL